MTPLYSMQRWQAVCCALSSPPLSSSALSMPGCNPSLSTSPPAIPPLSFIHGLAWNSSMGAVLQLLSASSEVRTLPC